MAGSLLLAIRERPSILRAPYKLIDGALLAWLLLAALMLAPVPARTRLAIAPASAAVSRAARIVSSWRGVSKIAQ